MAATGWKPAGSGAGWANSGNIALEDGVVASDSVYRVDFPEPESLSSASLLAGGFGISGLSAGDLVTGITTEIRARKSGSCQVRMYAYLTISGSPIGSSKDMGLLGASLSTTSAGGPGDAWGATLGGADLPNLGVGIYCDPTSAGGLTGVEVDFVRVYVEYASSGPNVFTFGSLTGQLASNRVESSVATISGLSGSATASLVTLFDNIAASPEFRKNGGPWGTASQSVVNGDQLQMRHTTSASGGATLTSAIQINGRQGSFATTTDALDTTPDAFAFIDQTGAEPAASVYSNPVAISGINAPSPVSITGGEYSINGGGWTAASGSITNGQQVQVRLIASPSYGGTASCTLTIGGVSDTFSADTRSADLAPDVFSFTRLSNQATSTQVESSIVTVSGIEAAASVTMSGTGTATVREYRKNGGAWTAIGATTVSPGDTLQLRLTTAAGAGVTGGITVNIGGVSDTWTATTTADISPDEFSVGDLEDVYPGDPGPLYSEPFQITGITSSVTASCPYASIARDTVLPVSGAYSNPNTLIQNNDYVRLRTDASLPLWKCGQQVLVIPVTIGDVTVTWTIYTKAGMPAAACIC